MTPLGPEPVADAFRFTERERRILLYALDGFIRALVPRPGTRGPAPDDARIALDLFNRLTPQRDDGMIVERIEPR
jgi:hypothetical protein